jgi:hypothetical protein
MDDGATGFEVDPAAEVVAAETNRGYAQAGTAEVADFHANSW